jgi:deoxyadenosine/deoxycytidine kinase
MERSVFSDRMVFVRAVHEAKFMSDMEISIYDSWFDPIVSGYSYFSVCIQMKGNKRAAGVSHEDR